MIELMDHQKGPAEKLRSGNLLRGGVGSGKSIVALWKYTQDCLGDLIVITTAKKRDSLEWQKDALGFGIFESREHSHYGTITVDSWNNIGKYEDVESCTFIFDEQRLVGYGAWVKSFLKIVRKKDKTKENQWFLLSGTPGDTWLDYAPLFIANGYYRNITDFKEQHVIYASYSKFPKVEGYRGIKKLEAIQRAVTVEMPYNHHTERHNEMVEVLFDEVEFKDIARRRWNPYTDAPCKDFAELFRVLRRVATESSGRLEALREIMQKHPKIIVFYQYNYELEMLRELAGIRTVAEWNGIKKQEIPDTDEWLYLVQYAAGSEGWNCIETNAIVFFGLTHSYKQFEQAHGRIERLNTLFTDLYYYVIFDKSWSNLAVLRSLGKKKDFNERRFARSEGVEMGVDLDGF